MHWTTIIFFIACPVFCFSSLSFAASSPQKIYRYSVKEQHEISLAEKIDKISKSVRASEQVRLIIEPGAYYVEKLTIPSNITLKLLPNTQFDISNLLQIDAKLEAPLNQIFIGAGSVSFGKDSVKEVYPIWWGAKADGITDDAQAIQKACAALSNEGVKRLVFTKGEYLIFKIGAAYKTTNNLGEFSNFNGIEIISKSASLRIDPNRPNTPRWGILFQFTDCENVLVDGFHVEGPPLDLRKSQTGCWFLTFLGNCRNIVLPKNAVKNMGCGYEFRGEKHGHTDHESEDTSKTKDINIGTLYVENSRYGITCMSSGNNLKANLIKSNGVGRSYIAWNIHNHDVNIESRNVYATDMLIKTYKYWHGNANIKINYKNVDSVQKGHPYPFGNVLAFEWTGYHENKDGTFSSGTMENIDINIHCKFNSDFNGKVVYFHKWGNPSTPDKYDEKQDFYDRGRKMKNFTLRGIININRWNPKKLDIAGPTPDTSAWGLPDKIGASPDQFSNFRIQNLKITGQNSRFLLGLNTFSDPPIVENVESDIPFSIDTSLDGRVAKASISTIYRNCNIPKQ